MYQTSNRIPLWAHRSKATAVIQRGCKEICGFSLVELLVVIVIILIIAGIAIPGLLAYRRSANEGSAIAILRTLHGAEMTYQASNREGSFAGSLSVLADASLIDTALGAGQKNGYTFTGGKVDATADNTAMLFYSAVPIKSAGIDRTGSRRFGIATDGVVRYSEDGANGHFPDVSDVMTATPYTTR